jgi:hypothetical protein
MGDFAQIHTLYYSMVLEIWSKSFVLDFLQGLYRFGLKRLEDVGIPGLLVLIVS